MEISTIYNLSYILTLFRHYCIIILYYHECESKLVAINKTLMFRYETPCEFLY